MATQVQTLRTNGFSALAGLKLGAHGPAIPLPPVKAEAIELEKKVQLRTISRKPLKSRKRKPWRK